MKRSVAALSMLFCLGRVQVQEPDTYVLHQAVSNRETIVYTRVIRFDDHKYLFHVQDYSENGRIQMDAFYTSFDKRVKEDLQCNYRSNTKEGPYTEWHRNGRMRFEGHFARGRLNGASTAWYASGQKEAEENWLNGQLHGRVRYWSENGDLQFDSTFEHGMNQHRRKVSYRYLSYLPKDYETDAAKKWPLVIYLHGGSDRGTDLNRLYSSGIPDQVYRRREFPFIMLAPQCPEHLRWSTDDWFERFYKEATARYRIDADRIYLTGPSLGGSGTWYIAARYPETFAAIAPISGFTSHLDYIDKNIDKLLDMPVWAFHGKLDTVVPFEETERIVKRLEGRNRNLRFSAEPDIGHSIHWQVYPGQEIYDWLLQYDRRSRKRPPARRPGRSGLTLRWTCQSVLSRSVLPHGPRQAGQQVSAIVRLLGDGFPSYASGQGDPMKLKVVLERSDEGGYTAIVPALPGCVSEGETREEALRSIEEAIQLYLEPVEDDLALGPDDEVLEIAV